MRKKFTLLMSFLLVAFFTFGQEWQAIKKVKKEKEEKTKVERGINPYRNAVDGIKVHQKASENKPVYGYSISDSPGQSAYDSNTLTELGWETFSVSETENITEVQIDYTWTTDYWASEGSFHIESPLGTAAVIAAGDASGTYSVILTDFEGEAMNGDWNIWIEDSWGDGGHQATNITVTFITPSVNDAGISEIVSLSEDDITYEGEKDMVVLLKNYGIDDLTAVTINGGYVLDGDSTFMDTYNWTGTLAQGETAEINLGTITLEGGNAYLIGAWTELPNGVADEYTANDTTGVEIDVYKKGALMESFEGATFPPKNWGVVNNDEGAQAWMQNGSYSFDGAYSASVRYEYPAITNDDWLITPKLLVEEGDELSFWARSTSSSWEDDFRVYVSKTGNEIDDFTIMLDEVMNTPYDWAQFTYNLTENENIAAGDEIYVAIQYFSFDQLRLAVDMFTGPMLADLNNDDVAVNEITKTILQPSEENMLEAVVQNVGLNDQTSIVVTFKVNGTEVGSTTIESLTYMESATASLNWTAPGEPGKYTVEAFVATDDNNENNSATKEVWVLAEQIAYVNDYDANTLYTLNLPNAQEIETISPLSSYILYASSWANGKWYAITSGTYNLVTVNPETGSVITIGMLDLNMPSGLAYDWTTNTMYVMDFDEENMASMLYTVDLETAELTRVGLGYTEGINLNLACDLNGNLYSLNSSDDKLYTISKTAGAGTPVGDLGIDLDSYHQDMEFDHANGDILYATAFTTEGGLYAIDTETGVASLLGAFTGGHDLGGFAIPYFSPVPQVAEVYPINNSEDNAIDEDIYVVFDQAVDSVDFSGITVTGANTGEVTNVMATLTDSIVTITHDVLENDDLFTVTIPAGAVTAEEPNEEITWSFGTIMAAPEYTVLSPVNEAQGVALDAEVSVIFNQEITDANLAGITMVGSLQGTVTNVSASVNPDGKTVVINHDDFTTFEDTITVTMPAGAVENEDGVTNSEITWEFYLMSEGQPVADSLAPANNETGVALDAEVLIRFNTAVTEVDLSGVTIEGATQGAVTSVVATLSDSTIHIAHDAFANNNELYTVTIPAGAVNSATSQPNAEIKWNFTSIKAAPQLVEMIPADGATKVALDQDIIFSFDQKVTTDYDLDTMITIMGENEDTVQNLITVLNSDQMSFTVSHDSIEYNNALYTVTIPAEVVYNSDGVMNADEVSWTFTTIKAMPLPVTAIPDSNAVDVPLDAEVSITFDQEITENDLGIITIESEAMGNVANIVATLADDNKTINIAHDDFFPVNEDSITVIIPASTVMNTDGVYNQEITWAFQPVYTYDITFLVKQGNTPVEDATVMLFDKEATTDTSGVAVIEAVYKGGPYEYSVAKSGYKTVTGTINVAGTATVAINFESAYTVIFNVTDGADPIEGATVHFEGEAVNTDADGVAEFMEVEPGVKPYIVMKDGYNDKTGTLEIVDANITKNIVLDIATGINDLAKQGISIYPNPSNGVFYINNETNEEMQLMIMDVAGRFVVNKTLYNSINIIDISDQSSGIYIIQLTRGEDTYNSKIILK